MGMRFVRLRLERVHDPDLDAVKRAEAFIRQADDVAGVSDAPETEAERWRFAVLLPAAAERRDAESRPGS